jgi:hypothetical protein
MLDEKLDELLHDRDELLRQDALNEQISYVSDHGAQLHDVQLHSEPSLLHER